MTECLEIDGDPAGTTVFDGQSLRYRLIGVIGREADVEEWMSTTLERVRQWCAQNGATLIWRRRPRLENAGHLKRKTARFITSKPMPSEIWQEIETLEGQGCRHI